MREPDSNTTVTNMINNNYFTRQKYIDSIVAGVQSSEGNVTCNEKGEGVLHLM